MKCYVIWELLICSSNSLFASKTFKLLTKYTRYFVVLPEGTYAVSAHHHHRRHSILHWRHLQVGPWRSREMQRLVMTWIIMWKICTRHTIGHMSVYSQQDDHGYPNHSDHKDIPLTSIVFHAIGVLWQPDWEPNNVANLSNFPLAPTSENSGFHYWFLFIFTFLLSLFFCYPLTEHMSFV
jgi:hypothetical protein